MDHQENWWEFLKLLDHLAGKENLFQMESRVKQNDSLSNGKSRVINKSPLIHIWPSTVGNDIFVMDVTFAGTGSGTSHDGHLHSFQCRAREPSITMCSRSRHGYLYSEAIYLTIYRTLVSRFQHARETCRWLLLYGRAGQNRTPGQNGLFWNFFMGHSKNTIYIGYPKNKKSRLIPKTRIRFAPLFASVPVHRILRLPRFSGWIFDPLPRLAICVDLIKIRAEHKSWLSTTQ